MRARAAAALASAAGAAGHGMLTLPASRNGGSLSTASSPTGGHGNPSVTYFNSSWYATGTPFVGKPTNCDPSYLTGSGGSGGNFCKSTCNPASKCLSCVFCDLDGDICGPWYAPGTAAIVSPCGAQYISASDPVGSQCQWGQKVSADGVDLPATPRTAWRAGSSTRVGWSVTNNHGGGYAYRLCPAEEKQTETCFQKTHLDFVGGTSVLHWTNGTELTIPTVTLSTGTTPQGSMWRRNPIPAYAPSASYCGEGEKCLVPTPCPGCYGSNTDYSIIDEVAVPKDLVPGNYTLSWRWDCELNPQVWTNCADITVVAGS